MGVRHRASYAFRRLRGVVRIAFQRVAAAVSVVAFADAVYFGGVAMVGVGLGGRYGVVAAGALLILSVRPLWSFVRKP